MTRRNTKPPKASVNAIRKKVFAGALELAEITGMLVPLIDANLKKDYIDHVPLRFLRRHLARNLLLVVTRLHAPLREKKQTGATASIAALLKLAHSEGRLSPELFKSFSKGLNKIKAAYTARGGRWKELNRFRHSELAHSLLSSPFDLLDFSPVWELAHDTFELVAALERYLDESGFDSMLLQNRFELWRDAGVEFWAAHSTYARVRES